MDDYQQERPAIAPRFRIWIKGRLSDGFADGVEGVEQETIAGSTVLTGVLIDQAQMYGVLDRLRHLGIDIERFETVRDDDPPPVGERWRNHD